MNPAKELPAIDVLKQQAKRLRKRLGADGEEVSHGRALDRSRASRAFVAGKH